MTLAITNNIDISVETYFHSVQANTETDNFIYSYRITIKNQGDYSVQLLKRHWEIFDTSMERRIVEGEGVVGEQPIISPGESYKYTSYCQLKTDAGSMKGYYTFKHEKDNKLFNAEIPEFILIPHYREN